MNSMIASQERDEFIRFNEQAGEIPDDENELMVDQYRSFEGFTVQEIKDMMK